MQFTIEFLSKYKASLMFKGRLVATFEAVHSRLLSVVTLFELSSSHEERLAALRIAVYQRTATPELSIFGRASMGRIESGVYNAENFPAVLDTKRLPEHLNFMDFPQLVATIGSHGGPDVVKAIYPDFRLALSHALSVPPLAGIVKFEVVREPAVMYDDVAIVRFMVEAPKKFTFWKDLSRGSDLHVIPSYHPTMQNRQDSVLLNGSTGSYIRGKAIQLVYAPSESRATDADEYDWFTWTKMKHPVKAEGQSFEVSIMKSHILSDEGVNDVVRLLTATLELTRSYVAVSGGFNSPYDRPAYVARKCNITLTTRAREARGSEGHCTWTYHTLQEEGHLRGSYVPEWFYAEGWLKAYPPLSADEPSR